MSQPNEITDGGKVRIYRDDEHFLRTGRVSYKTVKGTWIVYILHEDGQSYIGKSEYDPAELQAL